MAGTKLAYHRNVIDGMSYQNLVRNMEENDVISNLNNQSFDKRAEVLEQLRTAARRNGGRLPFPDQRSIFNGLCSSLNDSNWDVRHQCIQLIHELIPQFGEDLDECMSIVLEHLIPNIGDTKITVRRAVIQTIHVYMKYTSDIHGLFKAIVWYGLENRNSRIKKEMVISLPMVFTPEFSQENMFDITQALAKRLLESDGETGNGLQQHALLSLEKIRNLVGDSTFKSYLQKLSTPLRKYYYQVSEHQEEINSENNNKTSSKHSAYSTHSSHSNGHIRAFEPYPDPPQPQPRSKETMIHSTNNLEFGVVPGHIMDKLNDQSNFRARAQGVEELKLIIKDLDDISVLHPQILNFISFLNNLLDDSNFKITTVTLEILGILVSKLSFNVQDHLKPLVLALCKRMGDNKIVVRQAIMKVAIQLMQILSPKEVLSVICDNLSHRNSRVRQETLNIVIRSLLTFPSYEFDLGELCQKIAHTLIDPKRQVRQASLECFSVLAQAMGAGKLQPLVQAVDSVELSYDGDGVMAAVQSRLARRQLPRVNADGLIDYATPIPSSAASSRGSVPAGADIDWILLASGSSGSSARSARSDMELESIASGSARSTPVHIPESPAHTPRNSGRHLASASRRSKLPWDDNEFNQNLSPRPLLHRNTYEVKAKPLKGSKQPLSYLEKWKRQRHPIKSTESKVLATKARRSILDLSFGGEQAKLNSSIENSLCEEDVPSSPPESSRRLSPPPLSHDSDREMERPPLHASADTADLRCLIKLKHNDFKQDVLINPGVSSPTQDDMPEYSHYPSEVDQKYVEKKRSPAFTGKMDLITGNFPRKDEPSSLTPIPKTVTPLSGSSSRSTALSHYDTSGGCSDCSGTPMTDESVSTSISNALAPLSPAILTRSRLSPLVSPLKSAAISPNQPAHLPLVRSPGETTRMHLQPMNMKKPPSLLTPKSPTKNTQSTLSSIECMVDDEQTAPEALKINNSVVVSARGSTECNQSPLGRIEELSDPPSGDKPELLSKEHFQAKGKMNFPMKAKAAEMSEVKHKLLVDENSDSSNRSAMSETMIPPQAETCDLQTPAVVCKQSSVRSSNKRVTPTKMAQAKTFSEIGQENNAVSSSPSPISTRETDTKKDKRKLACHEDKTKQKMQNRTKKIKIGNKMSQDKSSLTTIGQEFSNMPDSCNQSIKLPKIGRNLSRNSDDLSTISQSDTSGNELVNTSAVMSDRKEGVRFSLPEPQSVRHALVSPVEHTTSTSLEVASNSRRFPLSPEESPGSPHLKETKESPSSSKICGQSSFGPYLKARLYKQCPPNTDSLVTLMVGRPSAFSRTSLEDSLDNWDDEADSLGNLPAEGVESVSVKPAVCLEPCSAVTFGSEKKSSRRRNRREDSPEGGYRDKHSGKRDRSDQPFSVYTPKGDDGRSYSTPSSGATTPRYDHYDDSSYKRMLNPIGASDSTVSWDDPSGPADNAPIPTKPINMASRNTTSKMKVPPITARQDSYDYIETPRDDEDDFRDDVPDAYSINKIRNSATKKKVDRIFSEMSRERLTDEMDSGIYSKQTSREDTMDYPDSSTSSQKKTASDNPFGKKPKRVARSLPGQSPKSETPPSSSSSERDQIQFQPIGGVSFRENKNADVAVVGKGYSDDSHANEPIKTTYPNQRAKDRKKLGNKAALSPLGIANTSSPGQLELDDEKLPEGLVGRGMFDASPASSDHSSSGPGHLLRPDRRTSQTEAPNPRNLPGVFGVSVKKDSFDKTDEEEEEDNASISMSRATREQMQKKIQAKKEEEAKKREDERRDRERREKEAERQRQERIKEEKERQQEKLRQLSTADNGLDSALTIAGSQQTQPPPPPQPAARKKPPPKRNSRLAEESPPTSHKSVESVDDEVKPFKDPHRALDDSLKMIQKEDWETKLSAIQNIRRLAMHHPEVLGTQLHPATIAILAEIKNLRSQVSRLAIVCLGELYLFMKKSMDTDLDQTTKVLLAKAGETNGFIREDADKSLHNMVENTTPNRAAVAIISGGASHRNTAVRKTAAYFLSVLVERMGPGRVLSGIKDVTDRILPTTAQFLLDASPETRYSGSKIIYSLMSHEDFDRQMNKHVSANTLRNIQDKLDNLRKRGLGDPPSSSTSATRRAGAPSSGSQSRYNSAADGKNSANNKGKSASRRIDDATAEEIKSMAASMTANDWRERQKGIKGLQEMCRGNPYLVNANIVKLMDSFIPTLKDSNSKVNLFSLQVLSSITPEIKDNISNLVSLILQNVSANLSSKNREIYEASTEVLDAFMENLEPMLLLQPFCAISQTANSRIKPDMIDRVSYLAAQVYPSKPKQVKMYVLPLLWHLLSTASGSGATQGATGSTTKSTSNLVQSLYSQMGATLIEQAQATSTVSPRMVQQLQDFIENP